MQDQGRPLAAIQWRWLLVGRAAWTAILVLTLALFVMGIRVIGTQMLTICDGPACYRWQPSGQLATELAAFGLPLATYAVYKIGLEALFILAGASLRPCSFGAGRASRWPCSPRSCW